MFRSPLKTASFRVHWLKISLFTTLLTLLTLLPLLGPANPILAQGGIIPEPPVCFDCPVPPPPINEIAPLTLVSQDVTVDINQQIATVRVAQTFRNDSQWSLEGTYLFPLPASAAVDDFRLEIGGELVEGQVLSQEEARRIYDEIVRRRIDPALLEYQGRGLFRASIFPIEPGQSRQVTLEYRQILPAEAGLVQFSFPLNQNETIEQATFDVSVQSDTPIKAVYSPSHPVSLSRPNDFSARATWEGRNVTPAGDFALYYSLSESELGLSLLSYHPGDSDGFFTMLIAPPVQTPDDTVIEKDVLLVLDTSGSMDGEKLQQAQEALSYILNQLKPGDRFNVIAFDTVVQTFAPEIQPGSAVAEAQDFVQQLRAEGSTDINLALLESLATLPAGGDRPAIVIFITDGLPTSGVVEPNLIVNNVTQAAPQNARIFTFGVGNDVDAILLDQLAREIRGTSSYVRPGQRVDEQVSSFYAKVSTPVLTDLALTVDGVTIFDSYPNPLPDLFAGTQLVVLGRYAQGGPTSITLSGNVNGAAQSFFYDDLAFATPDSSPADTAFIPRLWATRKIGYLLNQIRLQGENEEAVAQIVALSIRYGIITPYTAFLVEEPDALTAAGQERIIEQETMDFAAEAEAPRSGASAVDKAVAGQAMEAAESALPAPSAPMMSDDADGFAEEAPAQALVQTVGDKAFVRQNGVWVDTTFQSDQMTTQATTFASESYFELVAELGERHPQAPRYFALGQQVIVVLDGVAYEITPAEGQPSDSPASEAVTATPPTEPVATPSVMPNVRTQNTDPLTQTAPLASPVEAESVWQTLALAIAVLGLVFGFGLIAAVLLRRRG